MRKTSYTVLASVVSLFLIVGITTAAPANVMGDSLLPADPNFLTIVKPNVSTDSAAPEATQTSKALNSPENKSETKNSVTIAKKAAPKPAAKTAYKAVTPKTTTKPAPAVSRQTSTARATTTNKAQAVISTAKKYLNVPYVWGGTTPKGFDCSGFVQYVFAQNGINLPRISREQYITGKAVSFENLQPGDLVFFSLSKNGVVDHDGIYVGGGQFINASSSKGVTIYQIGPYWKSHYMGARRVL